jgi:polyketide cyclase/dehydrase/lipid transport protein
VFRSPKWRFGDDFQSVSMALSTLRLIGDRVGIRRAAFQCWPLAKASKGGLEMARAYYSTVFQEPAADIWEIVRDFNNYPVWVGAGESRIEDGKSGDAVGAIRDVVYQERRIRQRLLALSDVDRSQTYEFCGAPSLPVHGFQATLRITPIVDGDRAFVEWWASFDCEPGRSEEFSQTLRGWFAKWLESLRTVLSR